jgi:hypothetical protein
MFNLPTKCPGMSTYTQHVVCTGVKAHLRKKFPQAKSHHVHACLRCQMVGKKIKRTDLCRCQGFRCFSLRDHEIVVAFNDTITYHHRDYGFKASTNIESVMRSSRIAATAGRTTSTMSAILPITLQGRLAPFLLKLLQAKLEHEAKPNLIRRYRDPDV